MPLLLTAPSNTEALLHTALQLESARLSGTDTKCRHELLSAFPPVGPVLGSPLAFQTHQETESYTDEFRFKINYDHNYCYNAIKGRMLIFPSHLQHYVEPNESYEDRISVSFNIKLEE